MQPPMPTTPAPTEAPADETETAQPGGYRLYLDCLADGTHRAGKTAIPEDAAAAAPSSEETMADGGKDVESFEEGLKELVRLKQASPTDQSQDANFSAGFKSQNMTPY